MIGGLGSAVAEVLAECGGCRLERVGIQDRFGQSGDLKELMESYGLTAENLEEKALAMTKRMNTVKTPDMADVLNREEC